jgi:hypothetical protein
MNLMLFTVIWAVLAAVTLGFALYRKAITAHEDDIVHLAASEAAAIPKQAHLAERVAFVDRWGKTLTVITVVYGLTLLSIHMYRIWVEFGTTMRFN